MGLRLRAVELRVAAIGGAIAVIALVAGALLGEILHKLGISLFP